MSSFATFDMPRTVIFWSCKFSAPGAPRKYPPHSIFPNGTHVRPIHQNSKVLAFIRLYCNFCSMDPDAVTPVPVSYHLMPTNTTWRIRLSLHLEYPESVQCAICFANVFFFLCFISYYCFSLRLSVHLLHANWHVTAVQRLADCNKHRSAKSS